MFSKGNELNTYLDQASCDKPAHHYPAPTRLASTLAISALLAACCTAASAAPMYACKQPDGHYEFSSAPCNVTAQPAAASAAAAVPAAQPNAVLPLSAESRMKSCDPAVALAAAEEVLNNPNSLKEPLSLFTPASVLFLNGKKEEAVFWYYAAQLRTRYQLAYEKGDRPQLLTVIAMTEGQLIGSYALQDTARLIKTLDRVLEWDKKTPNPFRDKPGTANTDKEIEQLYASFRELKARLAADKDKYETQARKIAPEAERMYARRSEQCREGQIDPAFAEQETRKEWDAVIDFVKNNKDVIREAGKVKDAHAVSSTRASTDTMPSRYEVSVKGSNEKPVYAIVDVARLSGHAAYVLACTTHTPLGNRDPRKDACAQ